MCWAGVPPAPHKSSYSYQGEVDLLKRKGARQQQQQLPQDQGGKRVQKRDSIIAGSLPPMKVRWGGLEGARAGFLGPPVGLLRPPSTSSSLEGRQSLHGWLGCGASSRSPGELPWTAALQAPLHSILGCSSLITGWDGRQGEARNTSVCSTSQPTLQEGNCPLVLVLPRSSLPQHKNFVCPI